MKFGKLHYFKKASDLCLFLERLCLCCIEDEAGYIVLQNNIDCDDSANGFVTWIQARTG